MNPATNMTFPGRQQEPAPAPGGCPVCGRNSGRYICTFRPTDLDNDFQLKRCPHCRSAYVAPRPTVDELTAYFADRARYIGSVDPDGRPRHIVNERDRRRCEYAGYARRIRSLVPSGRALDVGCGTGLFLELLGGDYHRLGWTSIRFAPGRPPNRPASR